MSLRAIFFDLDGTLVDSSEDFAACVNEAREAMGMAPIRVAQVRPAINGGSSAIIRAGFDMDETHECFEDLHNLLLESYQRNLARHSRLFPGMDAVLERIGEYLPGWGLVTNKPKRFTAPLIKALELYPHCTVCPEQLANPKPDPEGLLLASEMLGVEPQQAIYVGDHARDIEAGRRAGCITVAAGWGFSDDAGSWGADALARTPADLLPIVERRL